MPRLVGGELYSQNLSQLEHKFTTISATSLLIRDSSLLGRVMLQPPFRQIGAASHPNIGEVSDIL
jgi:hypothetical protein